MSYKQQSERIGAATTITHTIWRHYLLLSELYSKHGTVCHKHALAVLWLKKQTNKKQSA